MNWIDNSNYPYVGGASYFNKYDYLPRIVVCPGVRMPSLENSLYNPTFKQQLREQYLGIKTQPDNNLRTETFSLEQIEAAADGIVNDEEKEDIKKKLLKRQNF